MRKSEVQTNHIKLAQVPMRVVAAVKELRGAAVEQQYGRLYSKVAALGNSPPKDRQAIARDCPTNLC